MGSLSSQLSDLTSRLPLGRVRLGDLVDMVGVRGNLLLSILLCLIFLFPISVPGLSTAFGVLLLFLGISHLISRPLFLPGWIGKKEVRSDLLAGVLRRSSVFLGYLERYVRPGRWAWWTRGWRERATLISFLCGTLVLMAPLGFIPLSNTLPALGVLSCCLALLQRDGFFALLGHLFPVVSLGYFSVYFLAGVSIWEVWVSP